MKDIFSNELRIANAVTISKIEDDMIISKYRAAYILFTFSTSLQRLFNNHIIVIINDSTWLRNYQFGTKYLYIYMGIVKNVSYFRCSAAAKYFAAKILYPQLIFAAALLTFAAILLSTECDPNSCGPKADGPFWDPKGRSYLHFKYWTHRWRIDINISRWISPIEPS